ncbi:PQQ-binding-like beta-propeller repeat protein [uncultured Desulfobacter sp.]|uniref:outer membrane protein assembly factor BamB family protein n=1 Tax=uncultured Desulfobacter sp. TaxID=240139 RepID=UPI0029F4E928|nr:PQQ-binding-like beta-propeller repeat protein [uncultured Desulfobacter sp.]
MSILKRFLVLISLIFMIAIYSCGQSQIDFKETRKEKEIVYKVGEEKPYSGIVIKKDDNGKIIEETAYQDGIKNGPSKEYWDNGKLKSETVYKDNNWNGLRKRFWENGKLRSEGKYINGKIEGLWKTYKKNGQTDLIYCGENGEWLYTKAENAFKNENFEQGIRIYKDAIKKGSTAALNGLAWFFATTDQKEYQNGAKAVKYASEFLDDNPDNPPCLDTLAAAYARNGQFDLAVAAQTKAVDLLPDDLKEEYLTRLALYKAGKAYEKKKFEPVTYMANNQRTGYFKTKEVKQLAGAKFIYDAQGRVDNSPVLSEGVVYFNCNRGYVYAVDINSGAELWKYKTGGIGSSSPAIDDGIIYIGSKDKHLYALDKKTGKEIWKFRTASNISSSPAIANGIVYFGTLANVYKHPSNVYAVDAKTGQEIWKFKTEGSAKMCGGVNGIAVNGDMVYASCNDRHLYALEVKNGKPVWKFQAEGKVKNGPTVSNGVVYFSGGNGNTREYIYAVDSKTGLEKWKLSCKSFVSTTPAVANGVLYFGGMHGSLYAVDIKDAEKMKLAQNYLWEFRSGSFVDSSPAVTENFIYFGSNNGNLYAVDRKNGKAIWKFKTGGKVRSSPVVLNGVVYFGSVDGRLYALH